MISRPAAAPAGDFWSGSSDARGKALSGYEETGLAPGEAGLGTNTRLVTLTFGGNDVGFAHVLLACVLTSCPEPAGLADGQVRHATHDIAALQETLRATYSEIQQKAPNAKGHIYVLGYPDIFGTDAALNGSAACLASTGLDTGSISWLYQRQQQLNAVIKAAAQTAGVHYVDPNASGAPYSFLGHSICAGQSWFHPLYANIFHDSFSFHPTMTGQGEMAAALVAAGATAIRGISSGGTSAPTLDRLASSRLAAWPVGIAADPDDASISGAVTGASGPLSGIVVDAYDDTGALVTSAETAADGSYTLASLAGGTYTVQFDPAGQNYVGQYYHGESASTADPVTVSPDAAVTGSTRLS